MRPCPYGKTYLGERLNVLPFELIQLPCGKIVPDRELSSGPKAARDERAVITGASPGTDDLARHDDGRVLSVEQV
jgi:hypothetical protein